MKTLVGNAALPGASWPPLANSMRVSFCIALVTLCSCKGLMSGAGLKPATVESAQHSPVEAASTNPAVAKTGGPLEALPNSPALPYPVRPAAYQPPTLPDSAWTGQPDALPQVNPHGHHQHGHSCPHCGPGKLPAFQFSSDPNVAGPVWMPDGIKGPWPHDEFICDGGDLNHDVYVKRDWTVVGLDQEDTVAHYDTLDGNTEVSAANCVCIYSPRFASTRKVTTPVFYEAHERIADVELPTKLNVHEENRGPKTAIQPEQLVAQLGLDQAQKLRDQNRGLAVDQATKLILVRDGFLPHEDLLFIQRGVFQGAEKARLAERVAAAIVWTQNQAVQVLIDGKPAVEAKATAEPQETVVYEREGKPCLRICKIADKSEAKPGEIITFTLRFDNVGDQRIGNVTVIDHLMPRLEYVEGSAESTLPARFIATPQQPNETTVLRWEIEDVMQVNDGGIIRFKAKVR